MMSIRSGDATVTVDADHGGRLAGLDLAGRQVLIGQRADRGPMQWGSFPMVPWAGRVRHGRFEFAERRRQLPLDLPPHAIHGTAYRQRWNVDSVGGDQMSMSCELAWEFGGHAWQRVEVGGTRVTCELGVVAGDGAMPAEIGWHPCFVKPDSLWFRPVSMYARDDEGIPTGELVPPPPGPWDDCFLNTEPVALRYAGLTVTVASDCDHWVVYDELAEATCVEPQSGPPDAFNLQQRVLEPGKQLIRTMTLDWDDGLASHERLTMR
jgi:aldose 1-epimerase